MKKLTVLFAAVLCAAMSFAACNEYGWTNKGEMFLELQKDFNDSIVAHSKYALEVVKEENDSIFYKTGGTWKYWEDVEAANTPVENANGDFAASTYNKQDEIYSILRTDKWQWLLDYIKANYKEGREDHADFDETYAILIRCNIQAFFFNSPTFKGGDQNPWSFDYTEAGKYANFQSAWGSTWCIKENCNPDGWKNKGEMFLGMQADYNAANSENLACAKDSDGLVYYNINGTWTYWEDAEAQHLSMSTPGFFQAASYGHASFIDWLNGEGAAKWGWLKTYIETVAMAEFGWDAAVWRAAISGFFLLSPANPSYPKTADFATFGQYVNWQSAWGQTFCTGGMAHVDYVLPEGAVTNDYGWTNAEDMYQALAADVLAYHNEPANNSAFGFASTFPGRGTFGAPDVTGGTGVAFDIQTFDLKFWSTEPYASKWEWLVSYIENLDTLAGQTNTIRSHQAYARYNLAAFFQNSIKSNYPVTADFTLVGAGTPSAYMPTWKHAFANPTDFAPDYVAPLNAPYKEGESFRGWFLDEIGATEPVDTLSAALTGMTLYGLFGKYVSTIAEVIAQEDNTDAYTGGVVTFINGKNIYIQDVTGGLLIYTTETPTCTVGQKITVSGKKVLYGGAPEVKDAVIEKMEAGTMPTALSLQLNEIVAGGLKYFGQLVRVNDVRIAKYDSKGNPFVASGADTLQCYKMVINQTEFPVGQRVNLTAIVGYYNAVQFVGDTAGFEKIIYQGQKDPSVYEDLVITAKEGDAEGVAAGEQFTYSIENNWLISSNLGNWDKNKPNQVAEQCRGMAVKNGIIYITYRDSNTPQRGTLKMIRYDAETGEKLADLPLKDYVFCEPGPDTLGVRATEMEGLLVMNPEYEWNYEEFTNAPIFGPNTDMCVDYAGNIMVANLPTEGHVYQIWRLTEDENGNLDGGGELLVYVGGNSGISDFATWFPSDEAIRLDRFSLAGDVKGDAWIFAASQNSSKVYEMDIEDGKWNGIVSHIVCQTPDLAAFSYSPRISVVDGGETFYVDGFVDYPMLFDVDGNLIESFRGVFDEEGNEQNPACLELITNMDGAVAGTGICGVHEFSVGGAFFLCMGVGSYEGGYQPYGSNLILRCQNEYRHFYEMTPAWVVSADGFGANKNAQFNYMQCSLPKDDLTTELYVFVAENGIGKYTIKADKFFGEQQTGLEAIKASVKNGAKKVMLNGRMYIIRDGKAFSAMGQKF